MPTTDGLEAFQKALVEAVLPMSMKAAADWEFIGETIVADLVGLDRPEPSPAELTEEEWFILELFHRFGEIVESREHLRDSAVYVRRFPYRDTRISRSRHLQWGIAGYLEEVYILKLRLDTYLNRIEKLYHPTRRALQVQSELKALHEYIESAFAEVVASRGDHVHRARLEAPDLRRLESLELFADVLEKHDGPDSGAFKLAYLTAYKETRRKWKKDIAHALVHFDIILDSFFDSLRPILIDEEGEFRYPSQWR